MNYDLERRLSPLNAGLHHIAGHQLQPLFQVWPELRFRPVEVPDEALQRIQLPEQFLASRAAIAEKGEFLVLYEN